jgi:hypothetical protein
MPDEIFKNLSTFGKIKARPPKAHNCPKTHCKNDKIGIKFKKLFFLLVFMTLNLLMAYSF